MVDLRVYRAALLPAAIALVVLMFSLEPRPGPLSASLPPESFDTVAATALAERIAREAPDRRPGGAGAERGAEIVEQELAEIEGLQVSEQRFRARVDGRRTDMRNVAAVIPGERDRWMAVVAHRDAEGDSGRSTSAAATAALVEVARAMSRSRNRRTVVLVSTDGGAAGAAGAREFARRFEGAERVDAAIVLDQPAVASLRRPIVQPWSIGPESTALQLTLSARAAVRRELDSQPGTEGSISHFLRLAVPAALGEQGVLINEGIPAVSISGGGGRPVSAEAADREPSPEHLGGAGRAAISTLLAIDGAEEVAQAARAYVVLAGQVVPGWAISFFCLTLLLAPLVATVDALARARRSRVVVLPWIGWTVIAALPFVLALLAVYALALVGLIPRPEFPYDPSAFSFEGRSYAAVGLVGLVVLLGILMIRPMHGLGGGPPSGDGPPVAIALLLVLSLLGLWALNPFLALLLVPAAHLWVVATHEAFSRRAVPALLAAVLGGVGIFGALAFVADRLGVGPGLPWHLLLFVSGGHVGVLSALLSCVLLGCLLAALAVAMARSRGREEPVEVRTRGPAGYAGPGSLGGTGSALQGGEHQGIHPARGMVGPP